MADEPVFEVSAELLRRGHDIGSMVDALTDRLTKALPHHVDIDRRRLQRRTTLVVRLDPEQFRLELHRGRATTWVDHVVRGVRVRSEDVDVDTWWDRLALALEREARKSTTLRLALEDALN